VEEFKYLEKTLTNQIPFRKILRADWSQGMLAIFSAESFVFHVAIQKQRE
jgi:hypothetical protein